MLFSFSFHTFVFGLGNSSGEHGVSSKMHQRKVCHLCQCKRFFFFWMVGGGGERKRVVSIVGLPHPPLPQKMDCRAGLMCV